MKKLLFLTILVVSCCVAQDIPSLTDKKDKYLEWHNKSNSPGLDEVFLFRDILVGHIERYLEANSILSKNEVATILTQWYRQEPELFSMKVYLNENRALGQVNVHDFFMIKSRLKNLTSDAKHKRDEEIVSILNDLGIKPNLSEDQLNSIIQAIERGEIR